MAAAARLPPAGKGGGGILRPEIPRIPGMSIGVVGTIPRVGGMHIHGRMAREKKERGRGRGRREKERVNFMTNVKAGIREEGGLPNHWCTGFGMIGHGIGNQ